MSETVLKQDSQSAIDQQMMQRLRSAADAVAAWEVVPRPPSRSEFPRRVRAAREELKHVEMNLSWKSLADAPQDPEQIARRAALLELAANRRMFRAAITAASDKPRQIAQLPRLLHGSHQDEPRVAGAARVYLRAVNGNFSGPTFRTFIEALQKHEPLNVNELWTIAAFLRFALLELILDESRALLRSADSAAAPLLMAHIKSLQSITHADWVYLIEPLIVFDAFLRQDPAGAFARLDFESREWYRKRVAALARRSDCSESQVAQAALALAREGQTSNSPDPRLRLRHAHVGYYLLDDGLSQLTARVGFHPTFSWRATSFVKSQAEDFFLTGIQLLTLVFIAAALFPVLPIMGSFKGLLAIVLLAVLPATQCAVDLVNDAITTFFDPEPLPKLDFSESIPAEFSTLVVVPTLLLNENHLRKLVNDLEVRCLGNRDLNLHFALLTDLADSVSKPRENDSHPLVDLAIKLINQLNAKYASQGFGAFLLLHRHRVYNTRQGVWMGWERKRGKLLDLNKLLAHSYDAFPIKAGPIAVLERVRYVLTVDSDTQLPRGEAARLVGAIAHPLNQAVIDPKLRIVTRGFGILQPRIGVAVRSTARSRLAAIFSGQSGFDIYSRAISDAYQDLFGEGIFTGKGIYEFSTLHAVLDRRFPRNALLSHDLIEGAYARAGLATDIELVDDYPTHYSAYIRRKHRWVRGDWQIAQWMFSRVPDESGHRSRNPISAISRWKIFDNLRRSLVDPLLLILFVAGWIHLPGGPLYWTIVSLFLLIFAALAQFAFGIGRALASGRSGQLTEVVSGFGHALFVAVLRLVFLPHELLLTFDAIARSLVRRFITGERLLEWETSAQTELRVDARQRMDFSFAVTPFVAIGLAVLIWFTAAEHRALLCAGPILLLWVLANPVTLWLNRPPKNVHRLSEPDRDYLETHALLIWRYFHEFGVKRHNYLIPDNVMQEGLAEAPRVSPTNIGLLLNARQAACELGFLTVPEFATLTGKTLATIDKMEQFHGHLFNWYDTETLKPLDSAPFVSSVDSGNLAASLYTLHAGARALLEKPLLGTQLFSSLHAHLRLLRETRQMPPALSRVTFPAHGSPLDTWIAWLMQAKPALEPAAASLLLRHEDAWWLQETLDRSNAIFDLIHSYLPWILPQFAPLRTLNQLGMDAHTGNLSCCEVRSFAERLYLALAHMRSSLASDEPLARLAGELHALLPPVIDRLQALTSELQRIERSAEHRAREMEFAFLVDPYRRILSIGYEMGTQRRHPACYDLVASEARIATFLAIARGDLPKQSWHKLGRDHTKAYGHYILLSWSGTMFEYLMPTLWMRSYPGTLVSRTQDACVAVHQAFGRELGVLWGVSESASSSKNDRGHYHYFAFGLPCLSNWPEATAGPVISPYSTFLALTIDPQRALENLRKMDAAGWVGTYGFFESADYSVSSHAPALAREWMAHHQGMSLLAITNLLRRNVFQQWFHTHPLIQATEMLLEEIPENKAILRSRIKESTPMRITSATRRSGGRSGIKAAL